MPVRVNNLYTLIIKNNEVTVMGSKPKKKDIRKTVQDYQKSKGEKPDGRKKFSKAGHQARNDAVGTEYEVRPKKD